MFARVTTTQGPPERMDEGIGVVQERVLPAARRLSGFKGVLLLADRNSGKSVAVTLWETEEAMRESEEAATRLRNEAADSAGEEIQSVERFEVALLEV